MMILVSLFVLTLAASPAGSAGPHDEQRSVRCIECHTRLPLAGRDAPLRSETALFCEGCHRQHHGSQGTSHPMGVVPTMQIPSDMVLDEAGKLSCFTCHRFHDDTTVDSGEKTYYLRRPPGRDFCFSCHSNF